MTVEEVASVERAPKAGMAVAWGGLAWADFVPVSATAGVVAAASKVAEVKLLLVASQALKVAVPEEVAGSAGVASQAPVAKVRRRHERLGRRTRSCIA